MKYDAIGVGYDTTRRADPRIAERILALLEPEAEGRYLDVACGTGNYTHRMHGLGLNVVGIDQSAIMLEAARAKYPYITWQQADVDALPFADATFDGAICIQAVHHFPDLDKALRQIGRVQAKGRLVLFTSTRDQMRSYWLNIYFPNAMRRAIDQLPSDQRLRAALDRALFRVVATEPWFVPVDPMDLFLYSGKHNPTLYLDERVRKGISTFASLADATEVERGLVRLKADIESGEICRVINAYEAALGDYQFVVACKIQ